MTLTKTQGQTELSLGYSSPVPDLFQLFQPCPVFFWAYIQQQGWLRFDQITESKS